MLIFKCVFRSDDIPIYHSCTSALHPVTFKETASYLIKESCKKKLGKQKITLLIYFFSVIHLIIFRVFFCGTLNFIIQIN